MKETIPTPEPGAERGRWTEVLSASFKLGLTSFGGPVAHLGYFHNEYVKRRGWLDERSYADLVALCQFLPGPASSQVGIGIGLMRAGWLGALAAWVGFTLPSALALTLLALLLRHADVSAAGWLHGLKLVAVAIVAQAVLGMGQKLAAGRSRAAIAVAATAATLAWPTALAQVALIAAAGLAGLWLYRSRESEPLAEWRVPIGKGAAAACLALFFGLLALLPLLRPLGEEVAFFDSFYRSGALVFGGGHVVLPLLERETVPAGWVSPEAFVAGYGAAQAVPGPLFTFAAYLGAVKGGVSGALLATAAIFLPAFLLIVGALPFWNGIRRHPRLQGALAGINAAVVGILLAALYDPLWTSSVKGAADFSLAAALFVMLTVWKLPPWMAVVAGAAGGQLLAWL